MDKSKDKILSEDSNVINPDLNPEVVGIDEEDKNAVILEQVEESHSSNIDDFNSSAEINIEKNNQITCSVSDELQEDTTQLNIVSNNSNGEVELQNIETVSEHSDELQPHEEYTKLDLPTTVKDIVELNDKNVVISDQASSDAEVTQLDCNVEDKLQRVEIPGQINCDDEKESEVECNLDNQSDRVVENIDDIISETEKCDNLEMIPEQKFSEDTNSSVKEVSLDARTENSADIDCSENNDLSQKDSDKVSPSNPEINDDLVQHHITEELSNKILSEDNEEETLCSEKLSEDDKISKQEIKINDSEDPVDSKTENIVEVEKSGEMGQLKIESTTDPSTSDLKNQISAEIAFLEKQAEAEFEMEDKETNLGSKHSESDESEQKGDNYIDISQFLINFDSINMTEENDKNDEHSSMIKDMESDDLPTKFEDIQQHMREGEQSCSDNEDTELCGISLEVEDFEDKTSCKEEELSYEPEFAVAAPQTKQPEFDNDETSTLEPVSQENNEKKSIKAEDLKAECDTGIDSLANFEVIDEIADEKNVKSKDVELPQKEITKNQSEEASKSSEVIDVIPKRSKIIKITLDDLPKSSKSSKILEIPGEEIDGGEFTRVVIIGSTYLSTYSDTWPADSKIKPFFIGKNDLSIQQYYTEFCHHPYLTGSKKIFVLFVIGLNDILIFKKYKARNCMEGHQEIKFPRSGKLFTLEYVKILVAKMKHIKKKLESNESLSVSFAYIPKVNFIEVINNLFLTSHKQYENCLCNYVVTKGDYAPINAQFNLGRETMNQFIFSKQLNKVRDKGFFEFLPMHLSYTDRKWIVHNERVATKIDGMSLDARLNNFIFPPASKEVIVPSKAVDDDFALAMDQLLGKMYFRVLIIGDSWLLPIMESWSSNTKIKPFFYCKDNLTLEETKDIILSVVKDESSTLVITTVPSGDLFKLESYYECEDHTPLLYPVPKKGICEAPLKYAHQLCKKVDLFQTEIRKLRKHCKVVFMTCYPVDFKMYYKYLTELHETETKPIKHSICRKLVDFNECKMYKIKVKICLKALNSHLVEVNMENGLHTCDIYSLSYKLNIQDKFMFPAYVPNLSPPNEVVKKLTIIVKRYVEKVHILYQKRKFSFHHIMDIMDSKNKMDEHNIPKQNANEVSDSKDPVPDKVSKSDKTQKSSIKMKEISKEDTHKEKSVEKLAGKVSKSKHPSDSASHKGAECIVKSLTCSSHHKAQERAGTARYPEKFYEAKHSSQKLEPHYHKNKERYSEKPPNEAKYPSDRYSQKSMVQSKRIPQEVRYPLSDAFEEDILEADRYKYKEFYRGRPSPPKDYRRGQDYRHSWKGSSRSRSPGRRPRSRTPRRYRSPSPSPRYRSKSPSSKRRRSRSPSRSKYSRDKRKRSKSYSPHKSSKRDRHASAKEEAVSDLWEIHSRECEIYRRNPEAHPDYDRVKRMWYEVMSSQGLNPYDVNLEVHWQEYWVKKMEIIFKNNWEDKKTKCLSLISSKARRRRSRSSSSSSRSSYSDHDSRKSGKHRHKKKTKSKKPKSKKKSKRNSSPSDSHARSKDKNLEHSLSLGSRDQSLVSVEELESRINAFMMKTRPGGSSIGTTSMDTLLPSMSASQMIPGPSKTMSEDTKLVDVTTILSQISDRFGALGMSLSVLHKKIVDAIKNGQNPLQCIDEDAKMLLELIGDKIKRLLGDCNLTLVQRTIIQEAHDRLMPFLESLEKKNQPNFGLDLDDIAKSTLGMQVPKIVNFIKGALTYKKVYDISNEDLMKIYVDVKAAQMKYVMQTPAPPSVPSITKSLDTPSLERPPISNFFPSFSLSGKITQPPPNYTPQAEVKQTRSAEVKNNFLSLSMNEKLKKFATFNTLPYEEKSFLLSHLDELEKTDKVLAQSLRFMMMQNH